MLTPKEITINYLEDMINDLDNAMLGEDTEDDYFQAIRKEREIINSTIKIVIESEGE